jgi:hypothetical protein
MFVLFCYGIIARVLTFQLSNLYVMFLAGSLFAVLKDVISNGNVIPILFLVGKAFPSSSIFFINLLIMQLLYGIPSSLLRIAPTATYKLYLWWFDEKELTRRVLVEVILEYQ